MTTTTTPADYLATLPPEIQDRLAAIARRAVGMSAAEKGASAGIFATVASNFALRPLTDDNELFIPGADMVADLALLVRQAHDRATIEEN